jgi:hypothetical protein
MVIRIERRGYQEIIKYLKEYKITSKIFQEIKDKI